MDSESFANLVKKKSPLIYNVEQKESATPVNHLQDAITSVKTSLQELHRSQAQATMAIQSAIQDMRLDVQTLGPSQNKLLTDIKIDTDEIKTYLKDMQ